MDHCSNGAQHSPMTPVEAYKYAYNLLHEGNYKDGFRLFEFRWHPDAIATLDEPFEKYTPAPVWQGENLFGKHIIVQMEMGYGDCIQFARFLPMLKVWGAEKLTVLQTGSLHHLMAQMPCIDYITNDEKTGVSQEADYWVGSMSLPYFATHAPKQIQYLFPCSPEHVVGRDGYLDAPPIELQGGIKIGVNWEASKRYLQGVKSLDANYMAKLKKAFPNATFYSLNPEDNGPFAALPTDGWKTNWLETASYMKSMDAVVTVDTGTAHCAGALGVPCYVILPPEDYVCWRWKTKAWYTSITIIPHASGIEGVIEKLGDQHGNHLRLAS
jgi:hypothetical protein